MSEDIFTITTSNVTGARIGQLVLPSRPAIDTPNYVANTSRGVVPHMTQDTLMRDTAINCLYTNLEDFIEQSAQTPPLLQYASSDPSRSLKRFLALPDDKIVILGARRSPPVAPPPATSNTDSAIAVSTSTGIRYLEADDYARYAEDLNPDIIVGLADVPVGRALVAKRMMKATDRSIDWVDHHLQQRRTKSAYFASMLPVSCANQRYYVDSLIESHIKKLQGLAIYSADTLVDLPEELQKLPKLDLAETATPLETLERIRLGTDLLVLPFVDIATDAGLALTFRFPQAAVASDTALPLGMDMWDISHATDLSPLVMDCTCYACTKHHRAYIQHLLSAKEMLGWVLLQIHNHYTMHLFFAAIRDSIRAGSFDADISTFARTFESSFPAKTGQGPRVRGYQRRSERAAEPKINPSAFKKYTGDEKPRVARSTLPKMPSGLPDDFDIGLLDGQLTLTED